MTKQDFGYMDFLKNSPLVDPKAFAKADDPLLSSTTAAWSVIYGQTVWVWANRQANFFGAIRKVPWQGSGVRVATSDPTNWTLGVGEEDTLTDAVKPTYALMKYPLKQVMTKIQYSRKQQLLSHAGDDSIPTPEQIRKDSAEGHILGINKMMLQNAELAAAGAAAVYDGSNPIYNGSSWVGTNIEALDRIISGDQEEGDLGGTHNGWYDPWDGSSYNRDAGTTYNAVVYNGDGTTTSAFTADSTLSLDAIDAMLYQCKKNGLKTENAFFLTGYSTYRRWKNLIDPKQRFVNPVNVTQDVNGVRTQRGVEGGFTVSSYENIPIILDQNCPYDAGALDKIFLIDQEHVFLRVMTPTIFVDNAWPNMIYRSAAWIKALEHESFFLTEGELVCTRFNTSGKVAALK